MRSRLRYAAITILIASVPVVLMVLATSTSVERGRAAAGVGLRNTSERLKYLYGADHTFNLTTLEGGGLLVAIDLPFRRS